MKERFIQFYFALSLRTHLILLAILLAIPTIILILHSGISQREEAIHKGQGEARRLVNTISMEQYNLTGDVEQLLVALAQIPDIREHRTKSANAMLGKILRDSPHFGNIVVAEPDGTIWASGLTTTLTLSLKEKRSFQNALKTKKFSSGEYTVGSISGKPTFGFAYPLLNEQGEVELVMAAIVNFDFYNSLLSQNDLAKDISFSFIDRNGVIVHRNSFVERYVGKKIEDGAFQRMKSGPSKDTHTETDNSGIDQIVSYRAMRLPGEQYPYLYIRATMPTKRALEKALRAELINIAILSPLLLIAIATAIPIADHCFIRRINKLRDAALRLASGDLQVRASDSVRGGELGELALAFDTMAHQLAEREHILSQSQRELHNLNESLAKRVDAETEKRLTHERLLARHARLAAIGEMIGAIAHQWRQPLATLGATIQGIRMAWETNCIDDTFMETAELDAQAQIYHMSDTIEGFRNFFRPEKMVEQIDIRKVVADVVPLVISQFSDSGVALEVTDNTDETIFKISGYQNELKQSILNLVSNSLDSILERRLTSGKTDAAGRVTISLGNTEDTAVIQVQDNGCGIPAEFSEKVFEPYFTSKSSNKGTGIGLYMSRLIVEESMGGRLSYTSGTEGTIFKIELVRNSSEGENNG